MIGGVHGKILHVNLTTGAIEVEQPPEELYRLLVGGRALVAYLLLRDLPPETDALSPENLLIFAPGIMQGTSFPGAGRNGVGGKSPLTGAIGSSEGGGWWGHEFKRTGFDALIVHGKAESPVYIWIKDGQVEIRSADHLWGKETAPVQSLIRAELGDERVRVAQIGPAGETLVRYAAVMNDVTRAAGRNGMGAVMGSKNLKAVAVRGTTVVPISSRERLNTVSRWLGQNYKENMAWATSPTGKGTMDGFTSLAYSGGLPTQNFGKAVFEQAEMLSAERHYELFFKDRDTCMACPVACKQVFELHGPDPEHSLDPVYGGPEYETVGSFGSSCGVDDPFVVCKANEMSNAYGLDTISTGMSIAFAMECFDNGIISEADTGGLAYCWGNGDVVLQSIGLIARREGFGNILAEGVARMAERFGKATQPFNMTVKGQELPMHEPRLKYALGLGYAVAPVGADHMMNMHDTVFVKEGEGLRRVNLALEEKIGPVSASVLDENKMKIFYNEVNWRHFQDCAVNCHFYPYDYSQMAEALSAVTGVTYSIQDILAVGARAQTLSRLFNLREGFTADDDRIPTRVMKAFGEGPIADNEISEQDFAWAKNRFYEMMEWDAETGEPTEACIQSLGLDMLLQGKL